MENSLSVTTVEKKEAYINLRAGISPEVAIVPSFSLIASATDGETPTLKFTRSNMNAYPAPTSVMITAFPNDSVDFPSTVNVNGALSVKFQASVKTAGINSASPPRSNYTGFPIYIFNADGGVDGYYDIVLKSQPSSGGVLCVIYDNNPNGPIVQQVNIYASNGTTLIGQTFTGGKQQNVILAGAYVSGQPQKLYGILSDLNDIDTITIPAAEADALHAATEEAKGFTLQP